MSEERTNPIADFVDALLKETQLDALPANVLPEYRSQLMFQVERRVGAIILGALPQEQQQEYVEKFVEPEEFDHAEMDAFVNTHIPDFAAKMQAGLDEFVRDFVGALQESQQKE